MTAEIALEVKGIEKSFPGTKALSGVNFQLRQGEIHALVGENGAGKSTLMNIIDGIYQPDAGEIFVQGKKVQMKNPYDAQRCGIGFVHQEIALCPHVTVAENVYMSTINASHALFMNYKQFYQKTANVLKRLSPIKPDAMVRDLSISSQQVVEIAKALTLDCKILILDEPTAALTESETDALFAIMQSLKNQGISIIYISHRMAEVFTQCDRVSILRDGHYIGTYDVSETDSHTIVNKMVGRELSDLYPKKMAGRTEEHDVLLEVCHLSNGKRFKDINFKLYRGEILGLAGLVGAGRSEVAKAICGLHPRQHGEVIFQGQITNIKHYEDAIAQGLVYLTEDRKVEGVFLDLSIKQNISAMNVKQVSSNGFMDKTKEESQAQYFSKQLQVKCSSLAQKAASLSGGNQQKILIAKLLSVKPAVILIDEPTRGIDVGAKSEIHKLIRELANQGIGVIMISSELPEVIGMCDRVLVMHEGRQSGILTGEDITEQNIIRLASGL
ncbi:ABC transporter, nucleotide binding/ATPase protein (Sugar) [Candidatus Moduliflexus flocculans]|uniref:ABC transporter, nucleotide binding/ATPase protein (Sugar) n=1 Tax=Candidatus Moduliflexus flocculans TaxID=1499966 RepID=A0A0S6VST8_9BACT|nr:ABC transporter, nucleotide binding/ATPase protein (Sugar) [Candidatus Moduliflexus flocculans]